MKFHASRIAAAMLLWGISFSASAVSSTYLPSYVGIDAPGSVAGDLSSSAPGFGTGSWALAGTAKTQVYWNATALFGHAVTVGDLQSISYWTNKPGDSTTVDWSLTIYTAMGASGNSGSWYQSRLSSEPYFTSGTALPGAPGGQWNEWTTGGAAPLRFYDSPRTTHFGAYDDPTLSQLAAGSVTFDPTTGSPVSHDYSHEQVLYFSLGTGSGWSNGFTGRVDGLTISTGAETVSLNLEAVTAVPEASTMAMMLAGLVGVGAATRRQRRR